jgi:hypothetical protein
MGFYQPVSAEYQKLFGTPLNLPSFKGQQYGGG